MNADITTTLKLVLEEDRVPHFDAESRAVDVALKKLDQSLDLSVHSYKRLARRVWQFASPSARPADRTSAAEVPPVEDEAE